MSLINQVLNQIEQRGAHELTGQSMVRAVPPRRDARKLKIAVLVLGVSSVVGALVWQWPRISRPDVVVKDNAQARPITNAAPASSALQIEKNNVATAVPVDSLGESNKPLLGQRSLQASPDVAAAGKSLSVSGDQLPGQHNLPASPNERTSEKLLNEPEKRLTGKGKLPTVHAPVPASRSELPDGELPMKQVTPAQQADAEFLKASGLEQQGRSVDAMAGYEAALRLNPGHDEARQALVVLLLESKRGTDAERVLTDGIKNQPEHAGFAMLLARLQVERGAVNEALATLEKSLPLAERQADYQAFLAALLQRQNRHNEAIAHYQVALQLAPNNGVWLMGYGISLRAVQRNDDARNAFRRALDSQTLSPELKAFVQQKLKEQ